MSSGSQVSPAGSLPCPNFAVQGCECTGAVLPEPELLGILSSVSRMPADGDERAPTALDSYLRARERLAVDAQERDNQARANRSRMIRDGSEEEKKDEQEPEESAASAQALRSERRAARMEGRASIEARLATQLIEEALLHGLTQTCPHCGLKNRKDDACIHMRCNCGGRFCYICGGTACQCDFRSIYLDSLTVDWGFEGFERAARARYEERGERPTRAHLALVWFHLRRCAFMIHTLKTSILPSITWEAALRHSPGLLEDIFDGFGISDVQPRGFQNSHPPSPYRWDDDSLPLKASMNTISSASHELFRQRWLQLQVEEREKGEDSGLPGYIIGVTCPRGASHGLYRRGVARNGRPRRLRCAGDRCRARVSSDVNFGCMICSQFLCNRCLARADECFEIENQNNHAIGGSGGGGGGGAAADERGGDQRCRKNRWSFFPRFRHFCDV